MLQRLFRWIVPDDVNVMGTRWRTIAFTDGLRWVCDGMNVQAVDCRTVWKVNGPSPA